MTAINVSPAARDLTAFSRVLNRNGERAVIRRAKREFFKAGGAIGVYDKRGNLVRAYRALRDHGRDKVIAADVAEYLARAAAREAAKAAARAARHAANLAAATSRMA